MERTFYHWLRETRILTPRYAAISLSTLMWAVIAFFSQRGSSHANEITGAFLGLNFCSSAILWAWLKPRVAVAPFKALQDPAVALQILTGYRFGRRVPFQEPAYTKEALDNAFWRLGTQNLPTPSAYRASIESTKGVNSPFELGLLHASVLLKQRDAFEKRNVWTDLYRNELLRMRGLPSRSEESLIIEDLLRQKRSMLMSSIQSVEQRASSQRLYALKRLETIEQLAPLHFAKT
jgi:hypothetical protein